MELIFEFLPILMFFIVFKWQGLVLATIAAIIANLIFLIVTKIKTGTYQKMPIISFVSLVILGGFSLICKKEIFIKWKPTAIYWILAGIFLGSHLLGKDPLIKKLSNNSIKLPDKIWVKLSLLWSIFFIFMGFLNLYIVYSCDTNTWVNFKLFGTLGLTIGFILLQFIFISKYLVNNM